MQCFVYVTAPYRPAIHHEEILRYSFWVPVDTGILLFVTLPVKHERRGMKRSRALKSEMTEPDDPGEARGNVSGCSGFDGKRFHEMIMVNKLNKLMS